MSWRCTFGAVLLLVGIILSPLHAVAATIPMLIAYDAAVRRSPTTSQVAHDGVRPEDEGPRINAYDCDAAVLLVYDDAPNLRVIAGAGGVHAYDRALELAERREVAWGPIYAAPAATPAAEGIYEFTASTGKTYVGQSGDIAARLEQHLESGKLLETGLPTVETTEVQGGKLAREIAEQQRINQLGGVENLQNIRNPIGPARQYLMPEVLDVTIDEQ